MRRICLFVLVILLGLVLSATAHAGATQQVLYSFDEGNNGAYPVAGVVSDSAGSLYGTTELAGAGGGGIVYEVSPAADGTWMFTLLHTFDVTGDDGGYPLGGLTFDNSGNLYGTTSAGGRSNAGTAYQLSPDPNGWRFSVIYAFPGGKDAAYPSGSLLFDGKDTLYGTAGGGFSRCTSQCGTVFQLKRNRHGVWVEKVLHRFDGGSGGGGPVGGLISDPAGNLYGTTILGGNNQCQGGCGTIFRLSRKAKGWKRTTLYRFTGKADGYFSYGGLVLDAAGSLYGVTSLGGDLSCNSPNGCGTVFRVNKNGHHSLLHSFTQTAGDGAFPLAGMALAADGTIYGTASRGGSGACGSCGVLFRLKGNRLKVIYSFDNVHGATPQAPLFVDASGKIFGTTFEGGAGFVGVVFEITP